MGMADENPLWTELWLMRIQPQTKLWQIQTA
jgi:hypothetical protein